MPVPTRKKAIFGLEVWFRVRVYRLRLGLGVNRVMVKVRVRG